MKIKSKLFTLAAFTIFTFGRGQLELEKIEDTWFIKPLLLNNVMLLPW